MAITISKRPTALGVGQTATLHGAPVKVLSISNKRIGRGAAVPVITVQDAKGRVLTVRRRNLRRIMALPRAAQRGPASRVIRH